MLDERDFIERFETADVEEASRMAARPSIEEERALRAYLGDERFRRMHAHALRDGTRRAGAKSGNVVVIPGVMGSHLAAVDRRGDSERIWLSVFGLLRGRLDRLRLAADGLAGYDENYNAHSTDVLKKYYGDALFSLSAEWNVLAFHFDWRKDINLAADELKVVLGKHFSDDAPVHIVAHSMGGLVARTFIKNHPERWATMWDEKGNGKAGGRLVMLGTPNHGSYNIPQAITGAASLVKWLARLDFANDRGELLEIFNSFVGPYQMLPSPLEDRSAKPLYKAKTYEPLNIPQPRLVGAEKNHESLREVVGAERMSYVAGYGLPTFDSINDFENLDSLDAYDATERGDGTVPHSLGLLDGVKTYYVAEEHGNLAVNGEVLSAMGELLRTGTTGILSERLPESRRGDESEEERRAARGKLEASIAADEERLEIAAGRSVVRGAGSRYISGGEREVEEMLVRGFLGGAGGARAEEETPTVPFGPSSVEIGLVCGEIQNLPYAERDLPIDALAVGHYEGVRPQKAELALDHEISRALSGKADGSELTESDLIITRYFERGTLRGSLGQPFFLPDPRDGSGRIIALAGMGRPGGFGVPELAVVARELCWSLGRMGKKHLATVLIGAGDGNIPTADAVSAWMRGIKYAVTGSTEDEGHRLLRITFVERDPFIAEAMHEAIIEAKLRLEESDRMEVSYHAPDEEELERRKEEERKRRVEIPDERADEDSDIAPTRITLGLDGGKYRFAAITSDASVPEREVVIDPDLVMSANDELAAEADPSLQIERGRFMEKLLVPRELRPRFSGGAPVVMTLDSTTARIHWEMVALPDLAGKPDGADDENASFDPHRFLGTGRGFTRQLRTEFAPPPEPPPPPRRLMRVLVIADPAEDARLAGAEQEGVEVADLFEGFNAVAEGRSENRVEVVRLFGPYEATRTTVMRHLALRTYDVVHFAGHCVYDEENPPLSGWIFSGGKRISAGELGRIDRIPGFVFSNACESGITPDRSGLRSAGLAPSFAEAFFGRGVGNFVCAAWPVDDLAAREFARTLYSSLLGFDDGAPAPMHEAMRDARASIAKSPAGASTWGAYQHYGSPYFRFFDPEGMASNPEEAGDG